jgi:hypothetical protein
MRIQASVGRRFGPLSERESAQDERTETVACSRSESDPVCVVVAEVLEGVADAVDEASNALTKLSAMFRRDAERVRDIG